MRIIGVPSLRLRLAVVFSVLVAVILTLVGVATYQLLRQSLLDEIERDVARRAAMFQKSGPTAPYDLDVFGAPDVFLQVEAADGSALARSGNLGPRNLPMPDAARRGAVVEVHVADRPLFLTATPLGSDAYALGHAIAGELAGSRLTPVTHLDAFWFAWVAFQPETRLVR